MGISQARAAGELGISPAALCKARKAGRVEREADGSYDVKKCRIALGKNSNPKMQAVAMAQQRGRKRREPSVPPKESGGEPLVLEATDYSAAILRETNLKIKERELSYRRKLGELVELAPINAYVAGQIIRAKDILQRIGPELRDRLAQETNPIRCEALVVAEVNRALAQLAEYTPQAT